MAHAPPPSTERAEGPGPSGAVTKPVVVITGASGMIGNALARRLAGDFTVVGMDIKEPPSGSQFHSVHYMDVTSDMSVRDALEQTRRDHGHAWAGVVHLAAYYDFSGEESPLYDKITVQGTRRLLKALTASRVERFVFSSTMLVHAPVKPGERIDESSPLDPRWAYPRSKLATEKVIHEERGGIPAALLRIAGVYTDFGQQPTLVHQIKRIYEQDFNSFFFPGDSEAGQALVHLDDTVEALALAVERRGELPDETAILIGEPDPPSYAQLQDTIGELLWGEEWPTIRVPGPLAKAGAWIQEKVPGGDDFIKPYMIELADDHYALDVSLAHSLLGWSPKHDLLDVLPDMLAGLRRDAERWYEQNGLEAPEHAGRR